MINTTLGEMDENMLQKKEGGHDNENETCKWVEYYFDGALVHRSVHLDLKKGILLEGVAANF